MDRSALHLQLGPFVVPVRSWMIALWPIIVHSLRQAYSAVEHHCPGQGPAEADLFHPSLPFHPHLEFEPLHGLVMDDRLIDDCPTIGLL
jgi:hypothetical protein